MVMGVVPGLVTNCLLISYPAPIVQRMQKSFLKFLFGMLKFCEQNRTLRTHSSSSRLSGSHLDLYKPARPTYPRPATSGGRMLRAWTRPR